MPGRDKRQQIMKAAERLFTGRRLHEITLDDVVKEAKVGKGTVYRHFENKDDLFFQVATSGFDELCELLSRETPGKESFQDQLLNVCGQIADFFSRRRQLFRMMQSEDARLLFCKGSMRDRWQEQRNKLVLAVATILERGAKEGKIRNDISAEVMATLLLGMLRTRSHALSGVPEPAKSLDIVVDLFCRGAGPGGSQ